MSFWRSFLHHLDHFRSPISNTLNGREYFTTSCSSWCSFCILMTVLLFIVIEFMGLKQITQINISESRQYPNPQIKINNENFKLAIGIFNSTNSLMSLEDFREYGRLSLFDYKKFPFNESDPEIHRKPFDKNDFNETRKEIGLKKCEYDDFKNHGFHKDYFVFNDLGNYFCPTNFEIILGGFWDYKTTSALCLTFDVCQNNTNTNITCKPIDEIKRLINDGFMSLYVQDNEISKYDYNNPIIPELKLLNYPHFKINGHHYYSLYLEDTRIKTSSVLLNFFFFLSSSYNEVITFLLQPGDDSDSRKTNPYNGEVDPTFFHLEIFSYDSSREIIRKTRSPYDVLGSAKGLLAFLVFIGSIFCCFFVRAQFHQEVYDRLESNQGPPAHITIEIPETKNNKKNIIQNSQLRQPLIPEERIQNNNRNIIQNEEYSCWDSIIIYCIRHLNSSRSANPNYAETVFNTSRNVLRIENQFSDNRNFQKN